MLAYSQATTRLFYAILLCCKKSEEKVIKILIFQTNEAFYSLEMLSTLPTSPRPQN